MLPKAAGSTEPTWSTVSPPSLSSPAVNGSTAVRCFSSVMVDALRASSNQEVEHAAVAEDFALSVAIGRGLGEEIRRIWSFSGQKEKGIWSKMKDGQ